MSYATIRRDLLWPTCEADPQDDDLNGRGEAEEELYALLEDPGAGEHQPCRQNHLIEPIEVGQVLPGRGAEGRGGEGRGGEGRGREGEGEESSRS